MKRTFIFHTEHGEILDLAMRIQADGDTVLFHVKHKESKKIGEGLIEQIDDWHEYMGKGCIHVFDGCADGKLQDWLRSKGEAVFGGSEESDALENDRQYGQAMFKDAGFKQPESHNFTDIDDALDFIRDNTDKRYILKQNGDAPKSINHMGKFDDGIDMIFHLEHLKKSWNEVEYGQFDCDLMEIVSGTEVAASAFWNGDDWIRDKDGNVVGFLNFEEKKECDGGLGATTGEMGTTFLGTDGRDKLFADILLRPKIAEVLRKTGFRGVFDINGCLTDEGDFVGFEPTCRFGVPATSYELIGGLVTPPADLIEWVARGHNKPIEIVKGVGMVMVVAAKPFPIEAHLEDDQTSMGEILWFLDEDGQGMLEPMDEQLERIHLYNFYQDDDTGKIKVATDCGYLLTVTGHGDDIESVREELINFIKNNIYIAGMKYRTDIGKRVEDSDIV